MKNKNDMSSGVVKLDLDELIRVCEIAIKASEFKVQEYKEELYLALSSSFTTKDKYEGYLALCKTHNLQFKLLKETENYCRAIDQYFYLREAKEREEVYIIKGEE